MADEVIKTRFEGDAGNLVIEVDKARKVIKKLSVQDLPLVQAELNSAHTAAQRTANGMRGLDTATKSSGRNMLVMAQVADDAQYGMRGLANQIPQLAMALGGGAGLAGVVSIAALAIWKLTPALVALYSSADPANVIAGAKEYGRVLSQNLDVLRATAAEMLRARDIAASTQASAAAVQTQTAADPTVNRIEAEIAAKARLRTAEDALIAARNRAQLSSAEAGGGDTAEIQRQQLARAQDLARARAAEDAASQSALSKAAAEAANRLQTSAENFAGQFKANIAAAAEEADRLKRNLAFAEAAAGQAQTEFDGAKDKSATGNESRNLKITKQRLEAEKQLLADALAQEAALRAQAAAAEAAFATEQKALADKSTAAAAEVMRQKESQAMRDQAAAAAKEDLENQLKITAAAQAKADADKASAAAKKAAKDAEAAAAKEAAQGASKADFATELQALRLAAAGRQKEAEALREKSRLAKEAAALAQATGISEEKALALVREKAALEKSVTDQKERGNRGEQSNGRIKLFKRGESATTFARPGNGLAKSVIEKNVLIAEQRRAQNLAAQKPENGVAILDDIHTVNKQLLKIWETNLGTV